MPTIKVPPVLRPQTGNEAEVSVGGATVGEALRSLVESHPGTEEQLFSPEGELNRYVNVYLNDEDVRVLDGLETSVSRTRTRSSSCRRWPAARASPPPAARAFRPSARRRLSTRAWQRPRW